MTLSTIVIVLSVHCLNHQKAYLIGGLLIVYTGCILIAIFIEKITFDNTDQEFASFFSPRAPYHRRLEIYQRRNKCCGKEGIGDFVFGSIAKGCCGSNGEQWDGQCKPGLDRGCLQVFQSHYVLIMVCHALSIICHIFLVALLFFIFSAMYNGQWTDEV